ncbi:MAG: chorismate mutase [Candidatus Zixiibacteriota bacterium]
MAVRGIRGAIQVPENTAAAIAAATQELLQAIVAANELSLADIISIFFTVTVDLNADYPAAAARAMGWTDIPLLDAQEIEVEGGMPRVIRVLMHVESERSRADIQHAYLGAAARLRVDIKGR